MEDFMFLIDSNPQRANTISFLSWMWNQLRTKWHFAVMIIVALKGVCMLNLCLLRTHTCYIQQLSDTNHRMLTVIASAWRENLETDRRSYWCLFFFVIHLIFHIHVSLMSDFAWTCAVVQALVSKQLLEHKYIQNSNTEFDRKIKIFFVNIKDSKHFLLDTLGY